MIRGCVFDLGGTIVDRYSATPLFSLKKAFKKNRVRVSDATILKDMGISKRQHVGKILADKQVQSNWYRIYNKFPGALDADRMYEDFKKEQNKASKVIDILPETKACFEYLKERDIKIGVTTGFDKTNMDLILSRMEDEGLFVDGAVSSTCLYRSRPHPDMIDKLRKDFNIKHPYQMIKFDDTPMGIKEANNGGYWSVGVVKWSSLMEITDPDDIMEKGLMASDEYKRKFQKAEEKLVNTGSDFVIQELSEINHVFREIYTHILYEHF